mgnify:CR=1 FL=1
MADVKWIKIVTDIFDDEKILLIESLPEADAIIVIWFKLLCLAGKQNNQGVFLLNNRIAYTDEMFATIFRRNVATVRLALKTFEDFGMIEIINGVITIPNWDKHQSLDALEKKREYQRDLMRKRREAQKLICDTNCDTNSEANSYTNSEANSYTNCDTNVSCLDKNKIRKEKNNNINISKINSDFEYLWSLYPNKKGKAEAFKAYKKAVKNGVTMETVEKGIRSFLEECRIKRTEQRYIPHGSTWFNQERWNDTYEAQAIDDYEGGENILDELEGYI